MKRLVLTAVLTLVSTQAYAAGFAIGEQGSSALGVGGAATAVITNSDSGFYNPAAYALKPGISTSVGATMILPTFSYFGDEGTTDSESSLKTPPYAYVGYSHAIDNLSIGGNVAFVVPYGAGLTWPDGWPGQYELIRIQLQAFEVNANASVGYKLGSMEFAVSAGPRYVWSTVGLERNIDAVDVQGNVELAGDDQAAGFQTAAIARLGGASLGVNYRSPIDLEYQGAADFESIPLELSGRTPDQAVKTAVTLPARLAFGAAYDHGQGTVSLDLETYFWSSFKEFAIDFNNPDTPDVNEPRNWENTLAIRTGYEYRGLLDGLALRGGFAWDPTPSPRETLSPTLPDSDRFVATLGAGYTLAFGMSVHATYARIFVTENSATGEDAFPGSFSGGANALAIGLSYETN